MWLACQFPLCSWASKPEQRGLGLAWAMDMWFYSIVSVLCRLGSSHPSAKGFCLLISIMETIAVVIVMSSAPMDI